VTEPPIRVLGTETLYEGRALRLVREEQALPDGSTLPWVSVVHIDAVLALPVDAEGFAYLVEQYRPQLGRRTIEAVGGGREPSLSPDEAMRRELLEEAGVAAALVPLGTAELGASTIRCRLHLFLARVERVSEPEPEPFERMTGHRRLRVPFDEAVAMALDGRIQDASSRLAILLAREHLGRAAAGATPQAPDGAT
jgi:8-oxo-dGTP pyrophosphatase MutT (NUDIX family)